MRRAEDRSSWRDRTACPGARPRRALNSRGRREAQRQAAWQEILRLRADGILDDPELHTVVKAGAASGYAHLGP